ncbi:MAG: Uma2 family endonuclease [Planctomycetales bacterium]|nr:Uma2 family endonuclease [Planctomycetales bacterium]
MSTDAQTPSHFTDTCHSGKPVPLLEPGDHLTRAEFERRYAACSNLKKAELIHEVVHLSAAVRFYQHGRPHAKLIAWLSMYEMDTPGVMVADNPSVRLDDFNECQPDALMMLAPDCGGHAVIDEDDYIRGAPEFVAEVASSSVSFDLHTKRDLYRGMNVQEYLVWRVCATIWLVTRQFT